MKKIILLIILTTTLIYSQFGGSQGSARGVSGTATSADVAKNFGVRVADIGVQGGRNFGVGVCPPEVLPSELEVLPGTYDTTSSQFGNYRVKVDNSIMVFIPAFYYWNGAGVDISDTVIVKSLYDSPGWFSYTLDSLVIHRMFIDGGNIKYGVFVDKYDWSLTNVTWSGSTQLTGIASSIPLANPISSSSDTKRAIDGTRNNYAGSFSNCISNSQTPADLYGGAWAAAKSRGSNFAVTSQFVMKGLALLSLAHGVASSNDTYCAWYHANYNYPKGNNNSGSDIDDATVTFTICDDGYWATRGEARKTGSGSNFAKTTHNGQNSGVADLNGNQWKIVQGLTSLSMATKNLTVISSAAEAVFEVADISGISDNDLIQIQGANTGTDWNAAIQYKFYRVSDISGNTFKLKSNGSYVNTSSLAGYNTADGFFTVAYGIKYYILKESVAIKDVTGGNSLTASDHFNSTYVAANFDEIVIPLAEGAYSFRYGKSTNQVLPFSINRTDDAYKLSCAGLIKDKDAVSGGGTNQFGKDYYYQWYVNELCPRSGGIWNDSAGAGVWYFVLSGGRASAARTVSARSCLYP